MPAKKGWAEKAMGFMDSYKQLEKLCGDMLGEGRVSAYIKEMSDKPRGAYL